MTQPAIPVGPIDSPGESRVLVVASPFGACRRRWASALRDRSLVFEVAHRGLEQQMLRLRPGIVFIDLALPGLGGLAGIPALQRLYPTVRFVLLTRRPNERQALFALFAGARGYCSRDIEPALIRRAVEVVERGEIWIGRQVVPVLVRRLTALSGRGGRALDPERLPYLAPREREIALLVGKGANNKAIASELAISEATVKAHLTSVFRKLKVANRLHLALVVTQRGGSSRSLARRRRATSPRSART